MQINILLLSSLLLFSGCAERGYILTTQDNTHTVTVESTVDLKNTKIETKSELKKMNAAVKKERRKNMRESNTRNKPSSTKTKPIQVAQKKVTKKQDAQKEDTSVIESEKSSLSTKKIKTQEEEEARLSVKKELEQLAHVEEQRRLKEQVLIEQKLAILKNEKDKAIAEEIAQKNKVAIDKQGEKLEKIKEAKAAYAAYKLKKAQESLAAKNTLDSERAEKVRLFKIEEKNRQEQARQEQAKQEQARQEQLKQVKDRQITPKKTLSTTQTLKFNMIDKIYHKFGSSEVHGHVIYLDAGGQETRLAKSKVYLLPVSAKLNNWFNNYYLKNKSNPNSNTTIVNYLNSTHLNIEKNFEFYGVAEGSYYVIIESNYPSHIAKNKKVYIAKKIKVGKYKKIMAVFSKKL